MNKDKKKIYFPHKPGSIGGPSSFQKRFEMKLRENGYAIFYPKDNFEKVSSVIFVVGGTKKILWLIKNKIDGIKIVLRLDGINDYGFNFKNGVLNFIKCRLIHLITNFIRRKLADHVVYQSIYVKDVWSNYGNKSIKSSIIYNAVNLNEFFPVRKNNKLESLRVIVVEGTVQGELALEALNAITVTKIDVYGKVHIKIEKDMLSNQNKNVLFHGPIPLENIPKVFEGRKIYLCLEINPACPNSVIEALASGVPVVGYDSGSLTELVGNAGIVMPYIGGNSDKMEAPNCENLDSAILTISKNYEYYSDLARHRAKRFFSLNDQFIKYKEIIDNQI
jgi:glycosyltransferase involved in cell wall biosynthesis